MFVARTEDEKIATVLQKNTFDFFNPEFEDVYEAQTLNVLTNLLQNVQAKVQRDGPQKEFFEELLTRPKGLKALLALNGFSYERFKRLTTLLRLVDDDSLDKLLLKRHWLEKEDKTKIKEWPDSTIEKLVTRNEFFRKGLVNLFFEGMSNVLLSRILPPFEIKKLSIEKLTFRPESMIDTLVRYKEKGSYSGKKDNNPETLIVKSLKKIGLPYKAGDLNKLLSASHDKKRRMDFIIPTIDEPQVIIECSFLVTTSSGQGDKSKTEIGMRELIASKYPEARFIGFIDGIGWYARQGDLKRMVSAFYDVFTFHTDELERFENLLTETFGL